MMIKERADATGNSTGSEKTDFTGSEIRVFSIAENTPFQQSTQCKRCSIRLRQMEDQCRRLAERIDYLEAGQ